jgi:integrase
MIRRTFQEGYVSKPQKSRNGVFFEIRYRIPLDNGKWRQCSERVYVSGRKAAKEVLRNRLDNAPRRPAQDVKRITFKQYVDEYFKPWLERQAFKPSTVSGYHSGLDTHLIPFFGDRLLAEIDPLDVERFVQSKVAAGKSAKTVRNLLLLLQGVYSHAEDLKIVSDCPVRKKHKPKRTKSKRDAWSAEQLKSIIVAAPGEYRTLFVTEALTGVRQGELLALQWRHFNAKERQLCIEQSLWRGQLVDPKTEDSSRTIQLGDILTQVLLEHQRTSPHNNPGDFIFCKPDGSHLDPDVMRKDVLYPILDRLGIPREKRRSGFHAFRHSAGSVVNNETGNMKWAQALLGHADFATTANTYVHTPTESEREASEVLERTILGDLFANLFVPRTTSGNQPKVN